MKLKSLILLPLIIGIASCGNSDGDPSTTVKDFFENLNNSNYNFTFTSKNEVNSVRTLEVYNDSAFLFNSKKESGSASKQIRNDGMFYIENQGVQDYELDSNGDVVVTFIEGPGKVNVPLSFAHDPNYHSDSQFSHIPLQRVLDFDYTKFLEKDGKIYSKDRDIIEAISLLSNSYFANWDDPNDGGEGTDYLLDFDKCSVDVSLNNGEMKFELIEAYTPVVGDMGVTYTSLFTIKDVGTTSNTKILDYMSNPTPLTKKSAYTEDLEGFAKAFGDVNIPFVEDEFSNLLSIIEDFDNAYMTVFDSNPNEDVLNAFIGEIEQDDKWVYDPDYSKIAQESSYYNKVPVYVYNQETTYDEQSFNVQLSVTYVSPSDLDDEDKVLRPNGFFYMNVYQFDLDSQIVGYEKIKDKFDSIGYLELFPMFSKVDSFTYQLIDMSEYIDVVDMENGLPIDSFYVLYISGFKSSQIDSFLSSWKEEVFATNKYIELDDDYGNKGFGWLGTIEKDDATYYVTIFGEFDNSNPNDLEYSITFIVQKESK